MADSRMVEKLMETADPKTFEIAIIGSGFAGIGLGAQLKKSGIENFAIFERASDVGGVWRDNSYPGCACDVESHLYSFSFAPNPNWSRLFSGQKEIWQYLKDCARNFGLAPHLKFNHEFEEARWTDDLWQIRTSGGTYYAKVLVSGVGAFSEPMMPKIPGLASFKGRTFHSARWNHDYNLAGKRVAVIGTGASAIQFVPEIQPVVSKLALFQRTPPWILPRLDRAVTEKEKSWFRRFPLIQKYRRLRIYVTREGYGVTFRVPKFIGLAKGMAISHMKRAIKDPGLREKLTPNYTIGCKRVLISNTYYPALTQTNVEVVTSAITEIREHSIATDDGKTHEIDAIIFGTGFQVTEYPIAEKIYGRNGEKLSNHWSESPYSFLGMSVAGFPNLFFLLGPNTGLGHSSVVLMIEAQIGLLLKTLNWMRKKNLATIEATSESERKFTKEIDRDSAKTVWLSGHCKSWYLDKTGRNSSLWPKSVTAFFRRLSRLDKEAYVVTNKEMR